MKPITKTWPNRNASKSIRSPAFFRRPLLVLVFVVFGMKSSLSSDLIGSPDYQPTSGKIYIHSEPDGAKVFVDKQEMPMPTPTQLDNLPLDKPLEIEVVKGKYQTHVEKITLTKDSPMDAVVVVLKHRAY